MRPMDEADKAINKLHEHITALKAKCCDCMAVDLIEEQQALNTTLEDDLLAFKIDSERLQGALEAAYAKRDGLQQELADIFPGSKHADAVKAREASKHE